jgi:hypothetical protein
MDEEACREVAMAYYDALRADSSSDC